MRTLKLFCTAFLISSIFCVMLSSNCAAENVYEWVDEKGGSHFGTKPPRGAKQVKPIKSKSFSTYSSRKVFDGYGIPYRKSGSNPSTFGDDIPIGDLPIPEENSLIPEDDNFNVAGRTVVADDLSDKPATSQPTAPAEQASEESVVVVQPGIAGNVELVQGPLTINHNNNNEVTDCRVSIRNSGGASAQNVIVNFEFEDGTLVPGIGPELLGSSEAAVYEISPEHLPVAISNISELKRKPTPKVVIEHG